MYVDGLYPEKRGLFPGHGAALFQPFFQFIECYKIQEGLPVIIENMKLIKGIVMRQALTYGIFFRQDPHAPVGIDTTGENRMVSPPF